MREQLPVPQSYPPNTAPEIDPATLCFESPISLSSNDTSLNGSQPIEQPSHLSIEQQNAQLQATPIVSRSQESVCNNYCDYSNLPSQPPIASSKPSVNINQLDLQQSLLQNPSPQRDTICNRDTSTPQQQSHINSYMDNIAPVSTEHQTATDYQRQQHYHNSSNTSADQQHASPLNVPQHPSPMFPPQSPQILLPNSPQVLAPQSPQVPQKSPLIHPLSPHVPPQSPHFTHSGPMLSPGHQQTSYDPRCRAGSFSKVAPPDLTPPPGTPSPSKHSPDRYQQYLQQNRLPQKSPNVTINSRDIQYGTGSMPSSVNPGVQNLNNSTGGYQDQHHQQSINTAQHFFPAGHYVDPRYFNHYQMQLAQATQTPANMYGHMPPASANPTAGMYGYH